jgi:hypothetical protein
MRKTKMKASDMTVTGETVTDTDITTSEFLADDATDTADAKESYTFIPGTTWGIRWTKVGVHSYPVIAKRVTIAAKGDTPEREGWSKPAYCTILADVARVMAAEASAGEFTTALARILAEEERLAKVIETLLAHTTT